MRFVERHTSWFGISSLVARNWPHLLDPELTPREARRIRAEFIVITLALIVTAAAMLLGTVLHARCPAGEPIYGCRAVDGDTLRCGQERVRLLGIDAPEMPGHCPRAPMRPRRPFHLEGAPRSQPRSPDVHRARGTGSLRSNTRDGRRTPRRSVVLATRRWRRNLQTLMGQWVSGRSRLQKSPLDTQGSYEGCGSKTRRR